MGFFFRKSKKLGLFRLNFSKSGIGASFGVKGARIGINAKGQTYVSAGRYGIGYRKVLSNIKRQKNDAHRTGFASARLSPDVINRLGLILIRADFVDIHQKSSDAAKYLDVYISMIEKAKVFLETLPRDGIEALLLGLMVKCYEQGHQLAISLDGQPSPETEEAFDGARLAKSLLRGHLEGNLTEEQRQIVGNLYFTQANETKRSETGISQGTKVFFAIVLLLSCSIISRCINTFQKPSQPSQPSQLAAPIIQPSPTPKIKKISVRKQSKTR